MTQREFLAWALRHPLELFVRLIKSATSRGFFPAKAVMKNLGKFNLLQHINIPPPPLPIWLLTCLWALTAIAYFFFVPSQEESPNEWFVFHLALAAAVATVGLGIFQFFWPCRDGCLLYYTEERGFDRNEIVVELKRSCLKPSVGKIMVLGSVATYEPYCEEHDPDLPYMERWLREHNKEISHGSAKRFRRIGGEN